MLGVPGTAKPKMLAIVSNTRCGSTWLATSLANSSSRIAVDYEAKLEDYVRSSVHTPIRLSSPARDLLDVLESVGHGSDQTPNVVGTKITLDASLEPHHQASARERYEKLVAINRDIPELKVIHLTRRFCGQSASRGGHTVTSDSLATRPQAMQSVLVANAREARYAANESAAGNSSHHCSAKRTLHRFLNDICVAEVFSGSTNYLHVHYETLHRDWERILGFLGMPVRGTLQESSVTRRNRRSGWDPSCELGQTLTQTRDELLTLGRTKTAKSVVRESICLSSGMLLDDLNEEFVQMAQDTSEVKGRRLLHDLWFRFLSRMHFTDRAT